MKRFCSYILAAAAAVVGMSSCLKESQQISNLSFEDSELYMEVGKTYTVSVSIVPEAAGKKASLIWSSSVPEVATVDASGVVTGHTVGKTVIKVAAEGGVASSATLYVTPVITGVFLPEALTVFVGGSTSLTTAFAPEGAKTVDLEWRSLNPDIATVSESGVVTGVKGGVAEIEVRYGEYTDICRVKVKTEAVGVSLNVHESHLLVEVDELQLVAVVEPDNCLSYDVDWVSSDSSIASVSEDGVVTPLNPGKAIVKVVVDKSVEDSCIVTVSQPAKEVRLDKENIELQRNETWQLTASVFPSNVSLPDVTWVSSNPDVAQVSEQGVVTAIALGEAVITVATVDDTFEGVQASCNVKVTQLPLSISLSESSISLRKDDRNPELAGRTLTATLTPEDISDEYMDVEWSTSDASVAVVEGGVVKPTGKGRAVITAKTVAGEYSATCEVLVEQAVTSVKILRDGEDAGQNGKLNIGSDYSVILTAVVGPEDADNRKYVWSLSDASLVDFDETSGRLTAKKLGTAVFTVTTEDGSYTDTYELHVTNDLSEASLAADEHIDLKIGADLTIDVVCRPYDAKLSKVEAFVLDYSQWGDGSLKENAPKSDCAEASATIVSDAADGRLAKVTVKGKSKGKVLLLVKLTDAENPDVVCYDSCVIAVGRQSEGFENEDGFIWD